MRSRLRGNSPRMTASVSSVMANGGRPSGASTSATATTVQISSRVAPFIRSGIRLRFLAEQAARTHHEDGQHHQVHEAQREIGSVVVAQHLDEADPQRAYDRPQKTAHPADNHDHEALY